MQPCTKSSKRQRQPISRCDTGGNLAKYWMRKSPEHSTKDLDLKVMNRITGFWLRARALTTTLLTALAVVGSVVVPATVGIAGSASASAAWPEYTIDVSKFNAGQIITDDLFFDKGAMTASEVQSFLNAKVPVCDPGYTCLKSKTEKTYDIPANPMCTAYSGAASETAASIIYKVGRACGISQKVILVTLQKEQGLVTDTWPSARQYKYAMGADCPDSGDGCGLTAGFFRQVYRGTYMMKRYTQPAGTGPGTDYETDFASMHRAKSTVWVRYGVDVNCGSKKVYISNQATHVLYVYTPYTPNAGALKAGWGTAPCGAYGNRNFFRYYFMWFGDPNGIPPKMTSPPDQTGDAVGEETVGNVLSVDPGTWTGNPKPSTAYQWYACTDPVAKLLTSVPQGCGIITGAKAATYTLTAAEVGKYVAPLVTKSNQAGKVTRMTTSTAFVYQTPANTVAPSFTTTARPSQATTVSAGTWTGLPAPTYTYKWTICPTATKSATCVTVANVTGASFTPKTADIGKFLIAEVSATNRSTVAVTTPVAVQVQSVPLIVKHYAVSGKAAVGATVTVSGGTWTAVPSAAQTYQFFACASSIKTASSTLPASGCSALAPASSQTSAAIPASARGKFIVTRVVSTNAVGETTDVTPSTPAVTLDPELPLISGTSTVGQTLSATSGEWPGVKTPIVLTLTGPKYDVYPIYGIQEALQADGYSTPRTGKYDARTIADVKRFQIKHKVPLADGYVGPRTWGIMKSLTTTTDPTFAYQWLRCTNPVVVTPTSSPSGCSVISGATASTYVPVTLDRTKYLIIQVKATNTSATVKTRWSLSTPAAVN